MTVYLFQDGPISDGGRYLGEFLVDAVTTTADSGFDVTVSQKAQRDAYDAEAWGKDWDDVVVFDELPTDRWTAFSETPVAAPEEPEGAAADDSAAVAPRPRMRDKTELEMLVPEPFRPDVAEHTLSGDDVREGIPESKWPAIRAALASGEKLPGEYWAQVTFSTPQARDDFLGLQEAGSGNSFEVEFDTAFDLADAGKVKIDKVFSRRRLLNAETRMHGSVMPTIEPEGPKVIADGLATIMRLLKRDLTDLQEFNRQLDGSLASAVSEKELLSLQAEELSADLKIWERDVAAADKTAAAFAAAVEAASSRLESAERRVVELGRELDAEVGRAVREIDLVAPPPAGRAAGRSAAAF